MLKIKTKKGFTLIEVVLSITILAVIVPPILSMVLTSVKTNKNSEDKQKALYIAQQTVEQEKSNPNIQIGTTTTAAIGFTVTKTITELQEYKFPDVIGNDEDNVTDKGGNNTTTTFSSINYDAKLEVNPSEDGNNILNITYYNANSNQKNYKQFNLNTSSNTLNITNYNGYIIINVNKSDNRTIENDPYKITSYKINHSEDTKVGNVIIEYSTDTQPNIYIHGLNNCDKNLIFYLATSKEKELSYSLVNDGGKIKSYYNIFAEESGHSYSNNSRVYRIDVEVSKNGTSLQRITVFKTVAE